MPNVTIRGLPDHIYELVKERAAKNRRSVNQELVFCLVESARLSKAARESEDAVLKNIRETRRSLSKLDMTAEEIDQAKRQGRP